MKISKALKTKNRIAGELAKLQTILRRENARRSDNTSKVDCAEVASKIVSTRERLVAVKTAVTVASVGAAHSLAKLAEIKAEIAFLESLPTKRGEEKTSVGYGNETITYTWDSFYSQEAIDAKSEGLQKEANALQDFLDEYNATTEVDFND